MNLLAALTFSTNSLFSVGLDYAVMHNMHGQGGTAAGQLLSPSHTHPHRHTDDL